MKIAICVSGHLRHYKNIKDKYESFVSYLKKFGTVNTFIATWNRQNTLNSWSHAHNISNPETYNIFIDKEEVKKHYQAEEVSIFDYDFYSSDNSPLSYKNFTSNLYNWDKRGIGGNVVNSSKMFFLINKCNELKKINEYKNNFIYDVVFRVRPDYEFDDKKITNILVQNINNNCIYSCPPYHDSPPIDDQFAFGNSVSMDIYASTINTVSMCFHNKIFGNPEKILNINCLSIFNINPVKIERVGCLGSDITLFKR